MAQLWRSVSDVFDYAMAAEQKAVGLYRALQSQAPSEKLKTLFGDLALQEEGHFGKLLRMRKATAASLEASGIGCVPRPRGVTLETRGITDIASAYRYAIRAEKGAARLYATLADMAADPEIRRTFEVLTQEELAHRAWLEADLAKRESGGFLKRLFRFAAGK